MEYKLKIEIKGDGIKTITPSYAIGAIVYLVTDVDQLPWLVVGYYIKREKIYYEIVNKTDIHNAEKIEITKEKNIIL